MKKKRKTAVSRASRKMSGLDKFLKESLAEDSEFKALFLKELKSLSPDSAHRARRRLGLDIPRWQGR